MSSRADRPGRDDGWRILVLGGGFAGLYAAAQLGRSFDLEPDDEVVLVDTRNYFTFTPLLPEVVGGALGREEVTVPFRVLAERHGFRYCQAAVRGIDPGEGVVRTSAGPLAFDRCVLAVGSRARYFGNDRLREQSYPLKTIDDAETLRDRVLQLAEASEWMDAEARQAHLTFVVAGGGPAGVEVASELRHLLCDILPRYYLHADEARIVLADGGDRILAPFDPDLARHGRNILEERGIDVRLETLVEDATERRVSLSDGEQIAARTLVWTAGVTPPELVADSPLPTGERGGVVVDENLRVQGHPAMFAVGDAAEVTDSRRERPYPNVAPLAVSQGIRAAGNIENDRAGREAEPYRAYHAGSIVSLGAEDALVDVLGLEVTGTPAAFISRAAYLFKMVGPKNKLRIAFRLGLNRLFERDLSTDATADELPGLEGGPRRDRLPDRAEGRGR